MRGLADAVGTRIRYDSWGDGPDLIFLHAAIADRSMWEPQIGFLADRYRCTATDLRGFGDTPIGEQAYSRRDDLAAVMDAVGVDSATLIGCSVGAGIALDFAIERPDRVDGLVLVGVSPAGFHHDDAIVQTIEDQVDEAIAAGAHDEAARLEVRLWVDGPRRDEGAAPQWLRDKVTQWCLAMYAVDDWGDSLQLGPPAASRLHEVQLPTLVIVGREDTEEILAGSRATARGIDSAELVELPGAAHLPNLEVGDRFNAALSAFLAS